MSWTGGGIIQSIASKNDAPNAMKKQEEFGIADYFLCPQISWGPKSAAIQTILTTLNLKSEAVAFVDDNAFERDEVGFAHPKVRTYDAEEAAGLTERPEFTVRFITQDSANRRKCIRRTSAARRRNSPLPAPPRSSWLP